MAILWVAFGHSVHAQKVVQTIKGTVTVATTNKKYSFAKEARLPRFYRIMRMMISGTDSGTHLWKHSRLNIGIPMLAYYTSVKDYPYHDRGVIPDYEVKPDIQDILNDKDVALDFTKQLITASDQ